MEMVNRVAKDAEQAAFWYSGGQLRRVTALRNSDSGLSLR